MEPFKITCVTCRARLAVRNASLIGQIIACPKCGSMVQVAAPTGANLSDSTTSGIVLAAAAPAATTVVDQTAASPSPSPPPTFDEFDVASREGAAAELAQWPPTPPAPVGPIAPPAVVRWSTAKLTVAATVSARAAGAAVVAAVFSLFRSDSAAPIAPLSPAAIAAMRSVETPDEPAPAALPEEAVVASSDDDAAEAAPEPTTIVPPADDNPFAAPPASEELPADEPAAVADGSSDSSPPATPTPPGVAPAANVAAADVPQPVDDASPRIIIDPLEVDPEGLDMSMLLGARGAADPLAASDLPTEPAAPVESAAPAAEAPAAEQRPDHRFEPMGPPSNVAGLLARRVPGVTIDEMPLCRFLDFASEFSGLPVSVSPDELRLAAVSAATSVKVDAKEATIEELLAAALKPLRLAPTVEGPQIVLRRVVEDKRRELAYPVDDLARGEAEMTRLAGWVQDLVAPEAWTAHGGDGTLTVDGASLRIDARERIGYETILFLERYRVARGLKPRSKYPAALLAAGPAGGELAERMQAPATFTFSQPTPLRAAVRWWQEETQTAILVDWPALADERSWPQSRITASSTGKPWGEAIAATLAPWGLGWRPVDARTIEITSLAKILAEPQLVLYRLRSDAAQDAADLASQVARLADAAGAATGAAFYDADQRVLMVRHPAAAQRRLVEWLAAERLLDGMAGGAD